MKRTSLLLGVLLLVCPLSLQAQDAEAWAGLPFHFDTPGARSLGMGSTTVAVTDDAALGAVNPASLTSISKRTFAAEYRNRRNTARFFNQGAALELSSAQAGVSSAMLVIPLPSVTWGVFYDEPLNASASTAGLPFGALYVPARSEARLRRYGVAVGWKIGAFSAGGSVRYDALRLFSGRSTEAPFPGVLPPTENQRISDGQFTVNAGLQWQATPALRVGAVYAQGAQYDTLREYNYEPGLAPLIFFGQFRTPSSLGAGASWSALPNVTVAADAVRIHYGEMSPPTTFVIGGASVPPVAMHDGTELHVGAEYRMTPLVAVRAGWWRDPAHGPVALGGPYVQNVEAALQPDANESHVTAGIGIGSERLRLDAAYDHGQRTRRASLGVVTTF